MSDGIKFPVAISGFALVAAIFGAGGMYFQGKSHEGDIAELKEEMRAAKATQISGERIARCEAAVEELKRDDSEIKEQMRALWRRRGEAPP